MIRIKCGTCGTSQGYKTPDSGELSLPASEEARLVARGVADYVTRPVIGTTNDVATPPVDGSGVLTGENPPDGGNTTEVQENGVDDEDVLDIVDGHFTKESLMKMTRTNMEKLADDLGVDVKKCKTKSDIADILVTVEIPDDGDSNPPVINPEGPVT